MNVDYIKDLKEVTKTASEKMNDYRMCGHDLQQRGRPDEAKEWEHRCSGMDDVLIILARKFPEVSELEEWR